MLIVLDVLSLGSRANIECVNARFCESSGTYLRFFFAAEPAHSRRSLLPLLRPPIAASAVQISSRWGGPGRYFQVFLRRRFARYLSLSRCLCPTGFATALRPCSSGISCKNVMLAHVSSYDHLLGFAHRIDRRIEPVNARVGIALIVDLDNVVNILIEIFLL